MIIHNDCIKTFTTDDDMKIGSAKYPIGEKMIMHDSKDEFYELCSPNSWILA